MIRHDEGYLTSAQEDALAARGAVLFRERLERDGETIADYGHWSERQLRDSYIELALDEQSRDRRWRGAA